LIAISSAIAREIAIKELTCAGKCAGSLRAQAQAACADSGHDGRTRKAPDGRPALEVIKSAFGQTFDH
jgi:hypothetical protein